MLTNYLFTFLALEEKDGYNYFSVIFSMILFCSIFWNEQNLELFLKFLLILCFLPLDIIENIFKSKEKLLPSSKNNWNGMELQTEG